MMAGRTTTVYSFRDEYQAYGVSYVRSLAEARDGAKAGCKGGYNSVTIERMTVDVSADSILRCLQHERWASVSEDVETWVREECGKCGPCRDEMPHDCEKPRAVRKDTP